MPCDTGDTVVSLDVSAATFAVCIETDLQMVVNAKMSQNRPLPPHNISGVPLHPKCVEVCGLTSAKNQPFNEASFGRRRFSLAL